MVKKTEPPRSAVAHRIQAKLRARILDGTYAPHAYIPSERDLAGELGTSRVTVAAALEVLECEGLVVRHHGRGTRVLPVLDRLSRPTVGVMLHQPQEHRPELRGTLATLDGILGTLTRFHCRYEVVTMTPSSGLRADKVLGRFGALVFLSPSVSLEDEIAAEVARHPLPLVMAKLEMHYQLNVSATWVDHREPTLQAVRTLAQMGHERIGFVTREPSYAFYDKAREGYLTGLREAGLASDEALIAHAQQTDALSGYFAAKHLLNSSTDRPTAIVAGRDTLAEGTCRAIEEAGMCVGHDVSVIGFDDMTWSPEEPFLTTFREPCYEMGVAAAEMLVERIVDPALPPEKRKFETPFILRRSIGPPMPNATSPHQESRQTAAESRSR